MISLADNLNCCFYSQAGGIGHSKAQLAAIALAEERRRAKEKQGCKSRHEEPVSCSLAAFPIGVARRFPGDGYF